MVTFKLIIHNVFGAERRVVYLIKWRLTIKNTFLVYFTEAGVPDWEVDLL